ncbi:AT-hook motif nuclear-localized protein 9-like isoform X1 [Zingiber officinale]|uniref:AT-hook motif nuclear-localized protein 9-like isoform X1 n=1 Tax=Zingiber officinale TaxID=94328 RepID=UPI001C4BA736|nr:AT-hook motif nuclear-localized protein 9-like isoform X1 [Zingiber officinale]XP_042376370.1 AT-hook motif nuclear-localized protein 9-like isoform X1 [Zingiber officinale]XP_042376371.1 AT-hook motif nuclear-localized protein 9-like isoform X1 [Zingiber officinale]
MDGRDAMELSGAASYYIAHRGIHGSSVGSQPGLHLTAQPGARSIPNLGTRLAVPPSGVDSVAFQVESPLAASSHGGGRLGKGVSQVEPVKRKRGRPRKYGQEGSVALALSPISTSAPTSSVIGSVSASGSGVPTQKRGRGRPPGTGRKQVLASLGDWVAGSAGMGFTPHVITIAVGEDIATKIMSFSQQGPRVVCILSANGVVSTVTLRQSTSSGGTVTYEGRFQILCLSGLYMRTDNGGSRSRTGGLSVCLSSPDGQIIGGGVAGVLIAATPVQVIVGSFIYTRSKTKNKAKASRNETNPEAERPAPYAALPNPNLTPSPIIGAWPRSRHLDMRNAHIDIDLMQG